MHAVDVTERVWQRIIQVRNGKSCGCCGQWTPGERAALNLYAPVARRDSGIQVFAQIGQSLDGRVATYAGDAKDVSGPHGLAHLHRLRALADGVLIGVGTALHDRPKLSVRLCDGDNPARIVIDPMGRMPDDIPLLQEDGTRRIIIQGIQKKRPLGVETLLLPMEDGRFDPAVVLDGLQNIGIEHLLVEGGAYTIARFLEAKLLTRLQITVSPLLIGAGPQGLTLHSPSAQLAHAVRPDTEAFLLGKEVVFDCALSESGIVTRAAMHAAANQRYVAHA